MTTIMVVEDEPNIRRFIVTNLQQRGITVVEASSAEEGIALLERGSVDAIILDIFLPLMNGWEFLQTITAQARWSRIPVTVMTASANMREQGHREFSNVVASLLKPISVSELLSAVALMTTEWLG